MTQNDPKIDPKNHPCWQKTIEMLYFAIYYPINIYTIVMHRDN